MNEKGKKKSNNSYYTNSRRVKTLNIKNSPLNPFKKTFPCYFHFSSFYLFLLFLPPPNFFNIFPTLEVLLADILTLNVIPNNVIVIILSLNLHLKPLSPIHSLSSATKVVQSRAQDDSYILSSLV